jgi:thiol-disulfide isomerase/thioredoxin
MQKSLNVKFLAKRWMLGLALAVVVLQLSCTRRAPHLSESLPELAALRGKPVLVHFWASWCPPCLPELPQMIEFSARVEKAGWTILAVATDSKPEAAKAALPKGQKLPANFRVVFDSQSKAAEAFGSFVFPETYWIDESGAVKHKWVGPQDWDRIASSGALGARF